MSDTFTGETYNTLCIDAEGYLVKESPEQARELLQKAISLIATRPRARSLLADTCMSMELWSEARSQLEILITLDEGNIDNNFKLAQVLEELGEYQLATDNYSVVLDDEPDHHGANVAIKRIEIRANESGVNLADIFNARRGDESGETGTDDGAGELKEGLQIFPDLPSDGLFADSEDDEENSVERLLKNIGLSDDSPEEEEDDISELLENIGVSTSQTLQSAFANSEDSDEEGFSEFQKEPESTGDAEAKKNAVRSLDEIFGTPSVAEEEVTEAEPETEKPEKEAEPEIEESEEEEDVSPFIPESEEKDEVESLSFNSGDTLEAIFNAPEADEPEEEEAEPEVEEPGEEETVPEVEEPEEEETVPETDGPEEEAEAPAEKEKIAVVLKQEADLSFDPWSAESRLLTVHMKSGTARVKHCMLTIYEKSIKTGVSDDEVLELFGEGTFLLNCGSQEPLIVDLKENMIIRKDAVVFHTGTITAELLDIPKNDSLYVIKEKIREKVIFKTDHPLRVILLGGNNRVFYLRTSSIMATDPEILLSHTEAPEGYTEITGFGKVYLIE
ncbi:MAG: hypothetical protein GQ565_01995 [Candidatus Aegiribacteria sp.]|nr:hypothetical protein [Candidatus Aegiribacteria sp.]